MRRWSRVLDLGAGTGSNMRYLAPRLGGRQHWSLVEKDLRLLTTAGNGEELRNVAAVDRVHGDLRREGLEEIRSADLVTASALLDLVSKSWLRKLMDRLEGSGAGVLLALTYDGSVLWEHDRAREEAPHDERVRHAINTHQRRDKGFGPALGSAATNVIEALLRDAGYETRRAPSPWHLGPEDIPLTLALIDGWERAAAEIHSANPGWVREWAERKRVAVRARAFQVTVGHVDLLALPR